MTSSQIIRELSKRKESIKEFLVELLVESGVKDSKVITKEKVVEIKKELTSDKETALLNEIKNLKEQVKDLELQLTPAEETTETIKTGTEQE